MSYRPYITIEGSEEKIYEEFKQHGEYLCDACGKVLPSGSPQVHLSVDATSFHAPAGPDDCIRIHRVPLDLHPECTKHCGVNILKALEAQELKHKIKDAVS